MEEIKSNAGQGLGTAGLILGILAIPMGIIPCTFFLGILFGVAGIVLSIVALTQANRWNGPKGLIIAALICSIVGFSIASAWTVAFSNRNFFLRQVFEDIRNHQNDHFNFTPRNNRDFVMPGPEPDTTNEYRNPDEVKALEDTLRSLENETQ